jgi:hypothetical protein
MKRTLLVLVLALFAAALFAQVAAARSTPYHAKLAACRTSDDAASGALEVDASVTPIRGTVRMGLRFDLYRRAAGSPHFRRADAPRLFMWRRSGVRPPSFAVNQAVDGLTAPAVYEMRVGFRWYGRHGRVLATRYHDTRLCRQPERRPNLRIGVAQEDPDAPGTYYVHVRNTGLTAAGGFDVAFRPGDDATLQQVQRVVGLAPGQVAKLTFGGPVCAGATRPSIVVDLGAEVTESNEGDNRRFARCGA